MATVKDVQSEDLIQKHLQELDEKGHEAYSQGQMDQALEYYRQRVDIALENDLFLELAECHKSIGLIQHDKGDVAKSIAELEIALGIQQQHAYDTDATEQLSMANTYSNLAQVHRTIDDLQRSLEYLKLAAEIEQVHAPSSLLLANTYNAMATLFGQVSNYKMALDFHSRACEIRASLIPRTLEFSCSSSNVGLILSKMHKHQSALEYLQAALDIEQELIPDSLDLADSYNNVAQVHFKLGNAEQACNLYLQALEIQTKNSTEPNLELAKTQSDTGYCLSQLGRYDEAKQMLEKAVAMEEQLMPGSMELMQTYSFLVACLKNQGLEEQAIEVEEKMHQVMQKQGDLAELRQL